MNKSTAPKDIARVTVRMPKPIITQLKVYAARTDQNISDVIEKALNRYLVNK